MSTEFDIATMKDKIAKLLAKAEGTTNEQERDAFTAKATDLMVKLGIDAAELQATGNVRPEEIVEVHRDFHGNYSIVMIPFCHAVALGFGDLQMLQMKISDMKRRAYIIGHKSDVEMFLQLMDSLEKQAMAALRVWQKEHRAERRFQTDMQKYTDNRSFLTAFGYTVSTRLRAQRKRVTEEADVTPGAALVLASKADRVEAWKNERNPNLRKSRGGARTFGYAGAAGGHAAGQRADIGNTRIGGQGRLGQ